MDRSSNLKCIDVLLFFPAIEQAWLDRHEVSPEDYRLLEVVTLKGVPLKAGHQWKFAGAFYYATNVLTTIGECH